MTQPFVTDYGGSGKTLVLLHGFLASSRYWRRLQPLLSVAGYRVITIDLLGFGFAPKPDNAMYDYRDHVTHIQNALEDLNVTQPITLVGHSMGALLALRFARQHRERVSSLILLHPPLYRSSQEAYRTLRSTGRHYRLLLDSKLRGAAWGLLRQIPAGDMTMQHTKQSREQSLQQVILAAEGLTDIEKVTTDTLVVIGSRDRGIYLTNARSMRTKPNVHVTVKPVNHHSPRTHSQLAYHLIHRFSTASGL